MMKLRFLGFALIISTFAAILTDPGVASAAAAEEPGRLAADSPTERPQRARPGEDDGPPTLVGPHKSKLGGYGSLGVAYTHMLGREGALVSLEGALLVRHRLSLGLAGYGFSQTPLGPPTADGTPRRFGVGYGGFAARYSLLGDFPVYATVGCVIGGGGVGLVDDQWGNGNDNERHRRASIDGFFLFQPELSLQTNVTRWFRVSVTGGYRFASRVDRYGLQSSDLNGFLVGGNLQFGSF